MFDPQQYNYYDYMDAWTNILFVKPEKHSLFIWFKKGISLKFPRWFIKWFVDFGPLPSIFLTKINEVYSYFRKNSIFVSGYKLVFYNL